MVSIVKDKNKTLSKKNTISTKVTKKKKISFSSIRKKYYKAYADALSNRYLFHVGLRTKVDGFKKGGIYPVFLIETEEMPKLVVPPSKLEIEMAKQLKVVKPEEREKVKTQMLDMLDDDDVEMMEEEKEKKEQEAQLIVWLLIANKDNGQFGWVDASKTFYLN